MIKQSISRRILNYLLILITLFGAFNVWAGHHSIYISSKTYQIKTLQNGHEISMDDFGFHPESGYPRLPTRTFYIPIYDAVEIQNVHVSCTPAEPIEGQFQINPVLPLVPSDQEYPVTQIMNKMTETKNTVYQSDTYYPENPAVYLGADFMGYVPCVKIQFTPFRYNPVRRSLEFIEGVQVDIDYTETNTELKRSLNKEAAASADPFAAPHIIHEETGSLLIIGSEIMADVIEPFLFWKNCLGLTTEFVTTQWIYANQDGIEKAEQIRNFLKIKYQEGIQNVILIGHRDVIPYPILYPNPADHAGTGEVATDFYFAQLTKDWDDDGDGYPGEFGDDHVDVVPEIQVGRIPWSDVETVRTILENSIAYEKKQEFWKSNGLLMGAISNFTNENNYGNFFWKTDGATLMELVKQNLLQNATTLYEKEGLNTSAFHCDLALNQVNVKTEWNSGGYGCVSWWSHGSSKSATRKIWGSDDGDNVPESAEMTWTAILSTSSYPILETNRPIVFANACDNGWPEKTCLGRKLIQNACTGIVSSSRLTYAVLGWDDINDGGNASLTYFFWKKYFNEYATVGEALSQAKVQFYSQFNACWQNLHNVYTFNYFGDPTVQALETSAQNGAITCQIISNEGISTEGLNVEILELAQMFTTDENGTCQMAMLPGGTYTLSISGDNISTFTETVTIENGTQSEQTIVIPQTKHPEITLSITSLDVTLEEESLSRNMLTISNSGEATLNYQLSYNHEASWLTVDESPFSIESGGQRSVEIDISSAEVDQGDYEATIQISSNCQINPMMSIPIKLTVLDIVAPDDINDLHISDTGTQNNNGSILLEWTTPGDNGNIGQADQYEIWASNGIENPVNDDKENGKKLMEGIQPKSPGVKDELWVPVNLETTQHIVIKTWDEAGHASVSNIATYIPTTLISKNAQTPVDFILPNYPNPFNGETVIAFGVSTSCQAKVVVYNEIGQQVKTLMNQFVQAGKHTVQWNATNDAGMSVPSGIYFYHVLTGKKRSVQKMLYIK